MFIAAVFHKQVFPVDPCVTRPFTPISILNFGWWNHL
jgi:hypothetical protein